MPQRFPFGIRITTDWSRHRNGEVWYDVADISFCCRRSCLDANHDIAYLSFGPIEVMIATGNGEWQGVCGRTTWRYWERCRVSIGQIPLISGHLAIIGETLMRGVAYEIWQTEEVYQAYDVSVGWYVVSACREDVRRPGIEVEFARGCRVRFVESRVTCVCLHPVNWQEVSRLIVNGS